MCYNVQNKIDCAVRIRYISLLGPVPSWIHFRFILFGDDSNTFFTTKGSKGILILLVY